ncbi:ABC transporter substrate-binding protein [Brevibacterium otitidis]|uniref:ABC transporter substrate-binding protein n=1 Tax=Brevibacterium otitidis TaxID=53364 RepID=A0ABV5WXW6_9MICO|nr:siderophore ABC transporter substrate-binding protein [Brevibacterium otitidis]
MTIAERPEKIVAFDGAAETLFALGAGDQVTGYFGAAPADLPADLAGEAEQTEHLGGTFPFPAAEAVLEQEPDLIVAYGFNDEGGGLHKRLDTLDIPYLNLSEACQDDPDGTIDGYLDDVRTIGKGIGDPAAGDRLADEWQASLDALPQPAAGEKPTAVVNGNQDPSKPFVSGAGSFASDLLTRAGLANAYADESAAFASPSWEDVAERNPDVLFSAGGGGDEARDALRDHLKSNPALAQMTAARTDGRVVTLDYARNVPGPQAIDGIKQMAEVAQTIAEGEGQDS